MAKTKFYEVSTNKLINIKNIALVEPDSLGSATKIRLDIKDNDGKFIVITVHRSWDKVASEIDSLAKS